MIHPYAPPQVQTADVIEKETQEVDDEFAKCKSDYNQINDAATEQKNRTKQPTQLTILLMKITLLKIYVLKTWIEDDLFNDGDNPDIAHVSKDILKDIKENDP